MKITLHTNPLFPHSVEPSAITLSGWGWSMPAILRPSKWKKGFSKLGSADFWKRQGKTLITKGPSGLGMDWLSSHISAITGLNKEASEDVVMITAIVIVAVATAGAGTAGAGAGAGGAGAGGASAGASAGSSSSALAYLKSGVGALSAGTSAVGGMEGFFNSLKKENGEEGNKLGDFDSFLKQTGLSTEDSSVQEFLKNIPAEDLEKLKTEVSKISSSKEDMEGLTASIEEMMNGYAISKGLEPKSHSANAVKFFNKKNIVPPTTQDFRTWGAGASKQAIEAQRQKAEWLAKQKQIENFEQVQAQKIQDRQMKQRYGYAEAMQQKAQYEASQQKSKIIFPIGLLFTAFKLLK